MCFLQAENSNVGTSRRQSDCEPNPPSSKRQKVVMMKVLIHFLFFRGPFIFVVCLY